MARHTTTNDYGTTANTPNKMLRSLILANHVLHWISALIVMSIAAYFIADFWSNVHLRYWVAVAAIDALLYIPALALPASNKYKGYMWPLAWIFSYLWLTAFIFAAQDYNYGLGCLAHSPTLVNKCALKKTLEAFAFIAFFTNLVGTALEGRLFDSHRFSTPQTVHDDKYGPGHTTGGPTTAQPVV